MKFYSDKTKALYDTQEELVTAEAEFDKKIQADEIKKKEKEVAAKKVEQAFIDADKAKEYAMEQLREFCKTYGSFKTKLDSDTLDEIKPSMFSSMLKFFS